MTHRTLLLTSALAIVSLAPMAAQSSAGTKGIAAAKTAKVWTAPLAADGHPDLQGIWSYITSTPLERPGGSGPYIYAREDGENHVGGYNSLFFDSVPKGTQDRPKSQIVDPPDGHLPPM